MPLPQTRHNPHAPALALGLLLLAAVVAWAFVDLLGPGEFVRSTSPTVVAGEQAASAMLCLFAALVLILFPLGRAGRRLRWVAAGLFVLGLGQLALGYLEPVIEGTPELSETLWQGLLVRIVAGALFAVGLVLPDPPELSWRIAGAVLGVLALAYVLGLESLEAAGALPDLIEIARIELALDRGTSPLEWVTPWYWALAPLSLGLAALAMVGAARRLVDGELPHWQLFAMVLFTGKQLHHMLWPHGFGSVVMTDADALRLAFVLVVAAGAVLELWRISSQRAALLAAEQERVRRMDELAELKADFSAMVAHELGSPTAAIRMLSELVSREGEDPRVRRHATTAIDGQVATLDGLINDVQTAAAAERDEFRVTPAPVPVDDLLDDARTFAATLPGRHPTTVAATAACRVRADRERIGQVLRNLVSNAAKHSPEGAPIELRARRVDGRVRLEVADHGRGIDPQDLTRIFEKYGRGRSAQRGNVAGAGLGLYISRGIVRAHGSELEVSSQDGKGAVFSFELEAER